ncbi:NAD(P)-dependent dehydrogenase, short-chain alcohol dehydrogenase family [Microbacterium hydrothermale]|uniref:SDR family NAD(P)-dependent oxidoreductase n=1 Tax=Microbacterium hydrothermale TaxID=857427 RepID=UPI0022260A7A|nr:SDR family oxidoreductase [Microbacterium hydrothermale]MCW2165960.1 NAD(P)-dependent dehydrogenase, short-chain alcohol dehydrogenase family [Microbacterium hydrothermale]
MLYSLVTGASRGIGRAIAVALSERGDRVAVHYGSDQDAAAHTLSLLHGEGHILVGGDLSDPAVAERVVGDVLEEFGRIDVLVNNAAIAPNPDTSHPVATVDYDTWQRIWERMVDVDLRAPANMTFLVARSLIDRGLPGAIVNVGSRGAFRGEPEFPAYGAAKAGLHAMGQSLAVALAPHGIAVTSVAPGFVGTDRQQQKLWGAEGDGIRDQSPFGRVATVEEVADAVVYLSSPRSQWASGAILDLNGASHLRS